MTARFYTYDPYFLPGLRRYSDDSAPEGWILGMLAVAIVVGVATILRPRGGSIATGFVLPLLLLTFVFASTDH